MQTTFQTLPTATRTKLNTVKVIFSNPSHNYITDVSSHTKEQDARSYFVGNFFNVGAYPNELHAKCIDIEFFDNNN